MTGQGPLNYADQAALADASRFRHGLLWHIQDFGKNFAAPFVGFLIMLADIFQGRATGFEWSLLALFIVLSGIGLTVGLHRLFSHGAFVPVRGFKIALGVLGSLVWQRPLFLWVVRHRLHHANTDRRGDYHSPHVTNDGRPISNRFLGWLHAHYIWLHRYDPPVVEGAPLIRDLQQDADLRWIDANYYLFFWLSLAVPAAIGLCWYGSVEGAFRGMIWGGLARIFLFFHLTWTINSVTHMLGRKAYLSRDESRNIGILGWIFFGEGYHNNHHAFPASACLSLDRGQFDIGWQIIRLAKVLGLVRSIRPLPSEQQKALKRLPDPRKLPEGLEEAARD